MKAVRARGSVWIFSLLAIIAAALCAPISCAATACRSAPSNSRACARRAAGSSSQRSVCVELRSSCRSAVLPFCIVAHLLARPSLAGRECRGGRVETQRLEGALEIDECFDRHLRCLHELHPYAVLRGRHPLGDQSPR